MTRAGSERPLEPGTPLVALRGVGPTRSRALAQRGYCTVEDLLFHLPSRYEDRRALSTVADLTRPGDYTVLGRLAGLARVRVRRRGFSLVRGTLEDATGRVPVVWFNRPYLMNQVEEGSEYLLHGELRRRGDAWELLNATCERPEAALATRGVVPIYPSVAGVGASTLRGLMRQVLERLPLPDAVPESLPPSLRDRHRLPRLGRALLDLHRPAEDADVEELNERRSAAHRRLAYGEFFDQQVQLGLARADVRSRAKAHRYRPRPRLDELLESLPPFRLTDAQRRAAGEIFDDLADERPMLRLLQGDVGCGKTIVAALALAAAAESGLQAALMAPTEILAEQHCRSLGELLPADCRPALLTGSSTAAAEIRRAVAAGDQRLVIGTHALIQESVEFERLGLVVVDEQHRFGVSQRRALERKGALPDLLVMTATPIPRSLTLTLYGDLDLSVIDELPPGRRPVETKLVSGERRDEVYAWLDRRLTKGSQAYVVLPLIEKSESIAAASIDRLGAALARRLAAHSPAVLHGRTPPEERAAVLAAFNAGGVGVLIATTVVEVGLDVPRADVMIIESAERFGLSQLHQLRGRVGRGSAPSHCVAVHGKLTAEAERRLRAFAETADGFAIAEADLEIRGPGDLLGTRQSGAPLFRLADLVRDRALLASARRDARELLRGGAAPPRLGRRDGGGRSDRLGGG